MNSAPVQPFRQTDMSSSSLLITQSLGLSNRPNPSLHPPIYNKPWRICRSFVYGGVCRNMACPLAHVPYNDMLDLIDFLMSCDGSPPGLRFVRRRLIRPDLNRSRKQYPSDRICNGYLTGICRFSVNCPRAHIKPTQVYLSLLPNYAVTPQPGSKVPSTPPTDPTASAVVPISATDEDHMGKPSEIPNCQERLPFDSIPFPGVDVRLSGSPLIEPDASKPSQFPMNDSVPNGTVRPPPQSNRQVLTDIWEWRSGKRTSPFIIP
ncbi:hypothetical protein B0F90DRAFT_1159512 [Multifurca ochricompacta]|uniref:C3H1-type domain-containing protein n=1 Tax=Multifurca ochricompacta TaxID=376703 RepID=A0AAD4QP06_9AGAM|nr:hypothetical protein B0F90DRAFT_1159512 [Multifurca ochricompacta]